MSIIVNVHEAKTNLSKLLERAHQGEEIILAKAGKPYARLVPLEGKPKERKLGILTGKMPKVSDSVFFDPLPEEELRAFEISDQA
jgi:prevent-host-death family protein